MTTLEIVGLIVATILISAGITIIVIEVALNHFVKHHYPERWIRK